MKAQSIYNLMLFVDFWISGGGVGGARWTIYQIRWDKNVLKELGEGHFSQMPDALRKKH